MREVSDQTELKEEEIELDLGLSIGGSSFRKSEKSKINGVENHTTALLRFSTLSPLPIASSEPESALIDPQTKREIQALRRQEAKRKREEKKSRGGGRNECSQIEEEQQQQQPASKKERIDANVNVNVNLNLSNGQMEQHRYPVQPVQYPYPPVQFVPCSNGFAYPCVMTCWDPASGGGGGFRPFQSQPDLVVDPSNIDGSDSDQQNGGFRKTTSLNGSPMCSSSTVSDHYSGSHEGGGSSDTRSHSSQCLPEQNHLNGNSKAKNHTATSHSFESIYQGNNGDHKVVPKEEPISSEAKPLPIPKPISPKQDPTTPTPTPTPTPSSLKEITKVDIPKPPKPQTQSPNPPSLPQMPYVSTTGNGPNGKTIHGFLYRYSKSEISIVCVCHGSTFSPAEFVQHAGGTDVSQPLRHITVIPSAFGG